MEQPTLSTATNQEFVDLIHNRFGKIATVQQVSDAREALKVIKNKADIEAIPRAEADTLGQIPVVPDMSEESTE